MVIMVWFSVRIDGKMGADRRVRGLKEGST